MSEQEIWQPIHRHLPADAGRVAGSPGAQRAHIPPPGPLSVCLASEAVFSETAGVGDVQTEEICADVSGLVCSERELLIPLPPPLPPPRAGAAPVPTPPSPRSGRCPCLVPLWHHAIPHPLPPAALPMADGIVGVGVWVNGDVWSPGMLLAGVWGDCGPDQ